MGCSGYFRWNDSRHIGGNVSFKSVAKRISEKKKISVKRASAQLAGGTRKNMMKRGMSVKHGIPKNVWGKK